MPGRETDYDVIQEIGTGSFGKCCLVRRKLDGQKFVWKQVQYGQMREAEKESLVREVNLLRDLRHPHIVRYVDRIVVKGAATLYLVMEYCAGGDLAQLIEDRKQQRIKGRINAIVPPEFVKKVFHQLLLALKELHQNQQGRILHRDLKPANVFLTSELGDCKLGDFGLARVLSSEVSMAVSYVGTPYYMSPEQVDKRKYNEASDIWSLGCLIYELCALHPPFTAQNQKQLYAKIKNGEFRRIPNAYSEDLQCSLTSMLKQNPDKRPSVEYLLQLPYLNSNILPKIKRSTTPKIPRSNSNKETSRNSSGYGSYETHSQKSPPSVIRRPATPTKLNSNNNAVSTTNNLSPVKKWVGSRMADPAADPKKLAPQKKRKTEEELYQWEIRLQQREVVLNKKEERLNQLATDLEKKGRVLQPVRPTGNSPKFDALAKLQNRLMPMSIRHKASKLVRSPSDPSRISKI